jgi:hypothetical protein
VTERNSSVDASGAQAGAGQPVVARGVRFRHGLQRAIGRIVGPLWLPVASFILRVILGYRIDQLKEVRAEFQRIRQQSTGPLLICANHLTLIDSFIVAWALAPTWRYMVHFDELPWNTPERRNFAATILSRILVYLAKCIPISRGGSREEVSAVLGRVAHLLLRGELAVVFPEGGRSRSGRVTADSVAWGVGRIVASVPQCRVACIYLRGENQESWGSIPTVGDCFYAKVECIEPKSEYRGARRSRDLANQIVAHLARMEKEYFDGRQ